MKTLSYDPNKKLMPQLQKMVEEYHNALKAHEHLGLAKTIPVQSISLLDFKYSIMQQCARLGRNVSG